MYIVSSFKQTLRVESAVTALEARGVAKKDILALPLGIQNAEEIPPHTARRRNVLDLPMILAALLAFLGTVYGFVLHMGPVMWAGIGTAAGFGLGLLIHLFIVCHSRQQRVRSSEVVILVFCDASLSQAVQDILWAHEALGVAEWDPAFPVAES